jgi:hypothetical protein
MLRETPWPSACPVKPSLCLTGVVETLQLLNFKPLNPEPLNFEPNIMKNMCDCGLFSTVLRKKMPNFIVSFIPLINI